RLRPKVGFAEIFLMPQPPLLTRRGILRRSENISGTFHGARHKKRGAMDSFDPRKIERPHKSLLKYYAITSVLTGPGLLVEFSALVFQIRNSEVSLPRRRHVDELGTAVPARDLSNIPSHSGYPSLPKHHSTMARSRHAIRPDGVRKRRS